MARKHPATSTLGTLAPIAALALCPVLDATRAAPAADDSETELAKKTQNPVADLISVPFQNNFNFNTGTKEETVYVLNVQLGPLPINTSLAGYYNADRPKDSSQWQLRFQIQFLFPK